MYEGNILYHKKSNDLPGVLLIKEKLKQQQQPPEEKIMIISDWNHAN